MLTRLLSTASSGRTRSMSRRRTSSSEGLGSPFIAHSASCVVSSPCHVRSQIESLQNEVLISTIRSFGSLLSPPSLCPPPGELETRPHSHRTPSPSRGAHFRHWIRQRREGGHLVSRRGGEGRRPDRLAEQVFPVYSVVTRSRSPPPSLVVSWCLRSG